MTFTRFVNPRCSMEKSVFVKVCTFLEQEFESFIIFSETSVSLPHEVKNHCVRKFRVRSLLLCKLLFTVSKHTAMIDKKRT